MLKPLDVGHSSTFHTMNIFIQFRFLPSITFPQKCQILRDVRWSDYFTSHTLSFCRDIEPPKKASFITLVFVMPHYIFKYIDDNFNLHRDNYGYILDINRNF